ncbi:LysR family transcriptional regulator [Alkalilimnicola sp. S0819]|nr:LysR family transcriptional regulator [Alkalilimnicola sp. S0819]MPQ16300.1 LysR family transcriptional regulator [Alkalilimnicola sp. S0819]
MRPRQLTIRLLQVYAEVVRSGSVTDTAARLHLTQPTVSQQLRRLREMVGARILHSRQGRLVPTEVGQSLYRLSQDVLSRVDSFVQYLDEYREGERGHFSIALVNTAQYVLPRLLAPFTRDCPDVDVTVEVGNREQVLQRFHRHEDDLYIFSHPPAGEEVIAAPFLANPLVVVAPADSPWARRGPLSFKMLAGERFLLREPGSATRRLVDNWLSSQEISLRHTQQIASNEGIRVAVGAGMGLAVLSEHVLRESHPEICILPVGGFPLQSRWQFVLRRGRHLPPAARRFLGFSAQALRREIDAMEGEHAIAALLAGGGGSDDQA